MSICGKPLWTWCKSRQIFEGAKDFCPNFHKFARKILTGKWPQKIKIKKRLHFCSCWAYFFKSNPFKHHFCPNFPNLPEKNWIKTRPPVKKGLYFFVKSKHIQRFCEGIQAFCPNFNRFCPDFHQIKSIGGELASPPPTPVSLKRA